MSSPSAMNPALPPPHGLTSNFVNPESLSKWNTLCVSVCLTITTIVFFLRTYVRIAIKREWILEDWFVCISWTGLVTYCALMTTTMHKHGGVHEWDVTLPEAREAIYWFNVTSVEYAPIILFTKLAILLLYRRVFLPQRWGLFDWALRIFMTVLILFYIATTIVKVWECTPRERIWNKSVPGTCIKISSLLNTSGLFNTITDTMILLVPVKSVWSLHMTKKRKVGVVAVFTVGFTAPVFSMIGFIVRIRISANPDVTWNDPEILLWAAAEVSTGLICVCIPTLAALAHRRRPVRPTDSILKGQSNPRRINFSGHKTSTSLEEQELWDMGHVELRHASADNIVRIPPTAVVTGIQGGVHSKNQLDGGDRLLDAGYTNAGYTNTGYVNAEEMDEANRAAGIVTTVRMEHSYV